MTREQQREAPGLVESRYQTWECSASVSWNSHYWSQQEVKSDVSRLFLSFEKEPVGEEAAEDNRKGRQRQNMAARPSVQKVHALSFNVSLLRCVENHWKCQRQHLYTIFPNLESKLKFSLKHVICVCMCLCRSARVIPITKGSNNDRPTNRPNLTTKQHEPLFYNISKNLSTQDFLLFWEGFLPLKMCVSTAGVPGKSWGRNLTGTVPLVWPSRWSRPHDDITSCNAAYLLCDIFNKENSIKEGG